MRIGEAAVVAPYRYTRMVFALILAMVFLFAMIAFVTNLCSPMAVIGGSCFWCSACSGCS